MYFYAAFSFDNTSLGLHAGPRSDPNPEFGILWSGSNAVRNADFIYALSFIAPSADDARVQWTAWL